MGLVDETYRYLYDTAAYYGTGVEYLIGGIILGALTVLWILVRLFRGKKDREREREREIVVRVMKEEEPRISRGVLEEPEAPGGITISPGEVVIKAEGKTTRIPRDRVTVDLRGGKLEIRVFEPEAVAAPEEEAKPAPEREEAEEVITAKEAEEAPSEEPRTLSAALKRIAKKHSLASITLITPDGLLVDSISKAPEEDAEAAGELLTEVELGKEPAMTSVEEEEESKYLFAIPFEDTHGVFLVKSREKIPEDMLSVLQEELQKSLELLLG